MIEGITQPRRTPANTSSATATRNATPSATHEIAVMPPSLSPEIARA
jgi:hypothetical protein